MPGFKIEYDKSINFLSILNLKTMKKIVLVLFIAVLSGCASKQTLTKFSGTIPKSVCIAKHEAVRDTVLEVLQEGFRARGIETKVISSSYVQKNSAWYPTPNPSEAANCEAIVFYVANWHWDLAMYMRFANIWVTDPTLTKRFADTSYQAGGGPDKFIDARKKLLSMVESL
ncbi:Sbal_3080 family lipoprotein [Undibacterium sp. Ji83W]|uniref:Sbal_3080 family lipoprotein n=1 Tax=Undibacterium sp. Ji83W TaxID=3413043 RepID=UPI003BF230EA